jgi:Domain of unknown function (DUF4190)
MKRCPRCGQTYTDGAINFCLNDGELLSYLADDEPQTLFQNAPSNTLDDSPATEFLNAPRVTRETNWPLQSQPMQQYQSPQQNVPQIFTQYPMSVSPNQTLAILSLGLGIGSMTIGWCCSMGLVLAPAALITGFIALSQIKKNPETNGGRGFAIAGIAVGSVFLALYLLVILLYGIGLLLGGGG